MLLLSWTVESSLSGPIWQLLKASVVAGSALSGAVDQRITECIKALKIFWPLIAGILRHSNDVLTEGIDGSRACYVRLSFGGVIMYTQLQPFERTCKCTIGSGGVEHGEPLHVYTTSDDIMSNANQGQMCLF